MSVEVKYLVGEGGELVVLKSSVCRLVRPSKTFSGGVESLLPHVNFSQYNKLSAFSNKAFEGLTSLKLLDLRGNWSPLPDKPFDGLASLQTFILLQNTLSALPDKAFEGSRACKRWIWPTLRPP